MNESVAAVPDATPVSTAFEPLPDRARMLSARMHRRLADSLRHIVERSDGKVAFDAPAIHRLIADLQGDRGAPPDTFAIYYDLVRALLRDNKDDAERLFGELAAIRIDGARIAIVSLTDAELGAATVDRYRRMMDTDQQMPFLLAAPEPSAAKARAEAVGRAIDLMVRGAPRLAAEFSGLVTQCVLASSVSGAAFGGGSSFMLWGALFINPARPASDLQLVETLSHEAAHSLLFGFAVDDRLVLNSDEQRFESPLRRDPRPMEGVYHATYVCARMHYAMKALSEADGVLDAEDVATARAAMARNAAAFSDGFSVVARHGRLTERGTALISTARDYMAAA